MSQDILRMICPNLRCRKVLAVPVTARGKTIRCGTCGNSVRVPASGKAAGPKPSQGSESGASKG